MTADDRRSQTAATAEIEQTMSSTENHSNHTVEDDLLEAETHLGKALALIHRALPRLAESGWEAVVQKLVKKGRSPTLKPHGQAMSRKPPVVPRPSVPRNRRSPTTRDRPAGDFGGGRRRGSRPLRSAPPHRLHPRNSRNWRICSAMVCRRPPSHLLITPNPLIAYEKTPHHRRRQSV